MSAVEPTVGASASSAARTAASPIPWIWVAMPSDAARAAWARSSSGGTSQTPYPSFGGGGSPVDRVQRLEQPGAARAQRAVGEGLEPAHPEPPERVLAERPAAREPLRLRGVQLLGADARVDADAQLAGRGEPPVRGDRPAEVRALAHAARVVGGDDAQGEQLAHDRRQRVRHGVGVRAAGRAR